MRIERNKLTTKFYTTDKEQVKKLLFELGIVDSPRYVYKIGPYGEAYRVSYRLSNEEMAYIKNNFNSGNIIKGFKGNLITSFTWVYG